MSNRYDRLFVVSCKLISGMVVLAFTKVKLILYQGSHIMTSSQLVMTELSQPEINGYWLVSNLESALCQKLSNKCHIWFINIFHIYFFFCLYNNSYSYDIAWYWYISNILTKKTIPNKRISMTIKTLLSLVIAYCQNTLYIMDISRING